VLREVERYYAEGMALYSQEPGSSVRRDRGRSEFAQVHEGLFYDWEGGALLFEQLDDGHWGYRCDEVTRNYALSSYRDGALVLETGDAAGSAAAFNLMCEAVRARKEVVIDAAGRDALSAGARAILRHALSDPKCDVPNGWRTDYTGPYVPHYEGTAKPD
jgi:hypothetical protein